MTGFGASATIFADPARIDVKICAYFWNLYF